MKYDFLKKPLILAMGAITATGALAEDEAPRKGAATALIEEVLVVSRKRSAAEAVQDVPLAITAFGADQLDAMYIQDLESLSYSAPNVQLEAVGTFPGVQNFSIRGQGINSSIPSVDPTVGTFIDGVYLGTTYGAVIDMFDIETVEILRGPQGLLFGRNVTGGAVSLRTARPDGEFGFKARTRVTDQDQKNVAAVIQGSLIEDKLAGKFVAYYDDDDGYFDNNYVGSPDLIPGLDPIYFNQASTSGQKAGAMETTLYRGTLVLQATDDLEVTLIAERGNSDGMGGTWTDVDAQRDSKTLKEFTTTMDEVGLTAMNWHSVVLEANLDVAFGDGTITNIAAYRDVDAFSVSDIDGSAASIFTVSSDTQQAQTSNELRYAGTFADDKWDVTAGLYYFEQDVKYREGRLIKEGALKVALGGDMDHQTWGFFINNDYRVTDDLTLTAGFRYTQEEKDAQVITGGCPDVLDFQCSFLQLDDEWSNVTPKLGFDYHLTDTARLYAFWTKGFRSGGVNFRNAKPNVIDPGPTKEEEQSSFELGMKSDLADGHLRLNAAYFYNTIDDMQRELNIGDPDVVVLQGTVNAGDAIIQGVEVDFVALLSDNFSINGSVGYLDGGWDKINPGLDPAIDPSLLATGRFVGSDLPRLSPWSATFGATYDMDLGDKGFLTLRGNYAFRDRAAYLDNNLEYFDQQHEVTASIDYLSLDGHWKVSAFGKNLNDEARWGNLTMASFGTIGPMQKGKLFGLEIEYNH